MESKMVPISEPKWHIGTNVDVEPRNGSRNGYWKGGIHGAKKVRLVGRGNVIAH